MIWVLILGGGLVLIFMVIGLVSSVNREKTEADQRIEQIVTSGRPLPDTAQRTAPLTQWLNRRVEGSSIGNNISKSLAQADLKMKPGEFIMLMFLAAILLAVLAFFIANRDVIFAMVGLVAGFFVPGIYVRSRKGRRLTRFDSQLPDMLNLMVNGLRAGFSTIQAMEQVSKELPPPICDEFHRVVQEMQLGVTMEKALDNLLRRIPSADLDLVITAINVQREVGGNLAEILDTISHTIRERIRIKGEIRVLTTQTMYSGRFLAMMPIFVILILYLLNKEYMMEFFKNGFCGYIPIICSSILIILGYITMNKLAQIDI
jgi:tight adherence protein B